MASTETSKEHQGNKLLKMLLANTRSAKGKTAEIQSLTVDYNIICLTETHLDCTVQSKSIIADPKKTVFRKDRNSRGGGVLIALDSDLNPSQLALSTDEEIIVVKMDPKIIICCYYRPHVYMQNINNIRTVYEEITDRYPNHKTILLGDMNLPEIDWLSCGLKHNAQHKQVHDEFLTLLKENNLQQLVKLPTYVLGNTLDLICTNSSE